MKTSHTSFIKLKRSTLKSTFNSPKAIRLKERGLVLVADSKNEQSFSSVAITLSRGFKNSVTRNRFKRCVREFIRKNIGSIPLGYNLIFILYPVFLASSGFYVSLVSRILKKFSLLLLQSKES